MNARAQPADGPAPQGGGMPRVVIEGIAPCIDGGRFAIKRVAGESVVVEANVFTDGHDSISCDLLHRAAHVAEWSRTPMRPLGNDRWQGSFVTPRIGGYLYSIAAWVDHLQTWRRDLTKRETTGEDLTVDFARGAALIAACAERARGATAARLTQWAQALTAPGASREERLELAQSEELHELARDLPDAAAVVGPSMALPVRVDRERARFSSWYELFPRSIAGGSGERATLADCQARLPYVAALGFDVLYLPPVHPIGTTQRKGPNNQPSTSAHDPGSPWAIGSAAGGHKSIAPELGTREDFRRLVGRARELGLEVALDLALQCSPDHPYVREHPEWFLKRPDGTIQYAENPPKKYQDIYPFHFETPAWRELWIELASIVDYWIGEGVRIFRVDNPHTKPFAFWEWLIARVQRAHPEVLFLAEAFTRPRVMQRLAKLGFTQSYTYFTWRNTRAELTAYFRELGEPPLVDYFRPNLWPNTPDILSEYLQFGGRPGFMVRLVLAATLGANYGIYGPAFELMEREPREPGSEEYRDSEKYQIRHWDLERADSLRDFIARINRIRRENPALQLDRTLRFHAVDNDTLIAYSKTAAAAGDSVLVVVNLDPHHVQSGWVTLDLAALELTDTAPFQVHDLLSGARFLWRGPRNFVSLDPAVGPAHILRVRRRVRTERDFDYFL
jgi:starch synthase (maltosyl-transferring)